MTTYLHKQTEVILTGRTAQRAKSKRRPDAGVITLHEVTPKNKEAGEWTDWVSIEDLFVIVDDEGQNERSTT